MAHERATQTYSDCSNQPELIQFTPIHASVWSVRMSSCQHTPGGRNPIAAKSTWVFPVFSLDINFKQDPS